MDHFDFLNKSVQACVKNASEHTSRGQGLRRTGHNNMAYCAALLALEEVGKAILFGSSRGHMARKELAFVNDDWFEDHM